MAYDRKIEIQLQNAIAGGGGGASGGTYAVTHPAVIRTFSAAINAATAAGTITLYARVTPGSDTGRQTVATLSVLTTDVGKVVYKTDLSYRIKAGNELIVSVPANVTASPMVVLEQEDENLDNLTSARKSS